MSKVLSAADPKVRGLRNTHPRLLGREIIGAGSFCQVFKTEDPTRVLKLTADYRHVSYLTGSHSPKGIFKPQVFENYGVVGKTSTGENIHLLEVEKLNRMPRSGYARKLMRDIAACARYVRFKERFCENIASQKPRITSDIIDFMKEMNLFLDNTKCILDMVPANFMLRDDNTLVWSDPVFDHQANKRHRQRLLVNAANRCDAAMGIRA